MKELNWPWRWDNRPHGWFTANGITRFGLLPKRESSDETWPPANLERVHQSTQVARAHLTSYPKSQKIP